MQTVRANLWTTNGNVRASAVVGNTLYLGGDFDFVGPSTGHGVVLDPTTGTATSGFPAVNGTIRAVTPDGVGGWYVGGDFSMVGGLPRAGLAHITADRRVDPAFAPTVDGPVSALALSGPILYVGGFFSTISGVARGRLAALDAVTGAVRAFDPRPSYLGEAAINRLLVTGGRLYVAGAFNTIAGQARSGLAAFDAATGQLSPFGVAVSGLELVHGLAVSGGRVFLGALIRLSPGGFRTALVAVDAATGQRVWEVATRITARAIAPAGDRLLVSSGFARFEQTLAAFNPATGAELPWAVPQPDAPADDLAVVGSTVYLGGGFTALGTTPRLRLAAVNTQSGQVLPWNPAASGTVSALAASGAAVFAGGEFSIVNGMARRFFVGLDLTTGRPTSFDPATNGSITTITPVGSTIYVTGGFNSFGGRPRTTGAAFVAATGQVTGFAPPFTPGSVYAAASDGQVLYIGGSFSTFELSNTVAQRPFAAALNLSTGRLTTWNPQVTAEVHAMLFTNGRLYLGGNFNTVAGQPRDSLAAVTARGQLTAWNPAAGSDLSTVRALTSNGSVIYFAGDFEEVAGQPRRAFGAADATTGALLPFNPTAGPRASGTAITIDGGVAYLGFVFATTVGSATRHGLAAVDPRTGALTGFRADLDITNGNFGGVDSLGINAIVGVPNGLIYVAGRFDGIAGTANANVAGLSR